MANDPLMVSISGVRGIAASTITPEVVVKYVGAFARLQLTRHKSSLKDGVLPEIVLVRDSRISGEWIEQVSIGTLICSGIEVVQCGIQPTPTAQLLALQRPNAIGALVVTSSHNPIQWNGLKFIDNDGLFLSPQDCEALFALSEQPSSYPAFDQRGRLTIHETAASEHIAACINLPFIHLEQTKKRNLKIVLDSVNGAGGPIMTELLTQLGCEVIGLNIEPNGLFSHNPEPISEHLTDLCAKVVEHKADLGIAVDPDVDRCVLIDETGKPLGEEYTLALAVKFWLSNSGKKGPVCKNLSSSRASNDIAKEFGCEVFDTPVGEIHVAKKMVEVGAVIGGEGNGGVMLPDVHIGRDALVAATLTVQHLASFSGTISELKATLPQYEIVKLKVLIGDMNPDEILADFEKNWTGKEGVVLNNSDGLRIDTPEYWVHMRKSNTEPVIRVIGEHTNPAEATAMCQRFMDEITSWKKS